MRLQVIFIGVAFFSGLSIAQAPSVPDLHLRGDRFKPLTYDKLTPEQKTMADHLLSGERGGMNGPFNVTLRSPVMGDLAQKLGAHLRFHSSLPNRLNELAIIMTARFWNAQYEWTAHRKLAMAAGLSSAVIDAIATGRRPTFAQPDEEIVYNFAIEMFRTRQVSDSAFKAVVDKFGERGAVDLTGVMGYYCFVSMMLNIDRYPLPEGGQPELKPLP
jgi:4-carboxymuconolactone decarboxylase